MSSISKILGAVFVSTLIFSGPLATAKAYCPSETQTSMPENLRNWVDHLNFYHPALDLKISADISKPGIRSRIEAELRLLEDALLGTVSIPNNYLKMLACNQPRCGGGGGGGGNCTTCLTDTVEPETSF